MKIRRGGDTNIVSSMEMLVRNGMDVYHDGYYKFVRENISRIGLWPYDDPKFRRIRKCILSSILYLSCALQLSGFLLLPFNMKLLFKFAIRISTSFLNSLYYTWFIYNEKEIKGLLDRIRADSRVRNTEERKLVKVYADIVMQIGRLIFYVFVMFLIVFVGAQIISALKPISLNETRVRTYPVSIGYFESFESYYFVIMPLLYIMACAEAIVSMTVWNLYIHFIFHLCAMYRVIGGMLDRVLNEREIKSEDDTNETHDALVRVVIYHNECIRFLIDFNTIFEHLCLIQMSIMIGLMALDLLYLAGMKYPVTDYNDLFMHLLNIGGHFSVLFTYCHLGQYVADHGVDFYKKACTASWYLTPPRIQRMSLLIIAKSAEPQYVSIGRMFVYSYETLIAVMNTSLSYAMVYHSRKDA